VVLALLGLLAMTVPLIANENVTGILGWLFLASGATGLATTYWARQAPGFLWSLVSALLAIFVGVVLIENKSEDLYGGLLGWPFHDAGPLRMILVAFFLIEGALSIMFAIEHRRQFSTRWAFMLASGIVDIVLGGPHHFCASGDLCLDNGTSRGGQHGRRGRGSYRDRNSCSYGMGRREYNSSAEPLIDPLTKADYAKRLRGLRYRWRKDGVCD
jgi:uncharacterized membrane protein HdeD (DUF308 family)